MIGTSRPPAVQTYDRGLEGLVAGETAIAAIDGRHGRLSYRGIPVEELAEGCSFEEVAHLVLYGDLPTGHALEAWRRELAGWRQPPAEAMAILDLLPRNAHPLAKYRTMLTIAACHIPDPGGTDIQAQLRRPARILSWTASLAAAAIRHLRGLDPVPPEPDLAFAASFLQQVLGHPPPPAVARAFDVSLIVQCEHGLHAAAFAALTVASAGADLGSAVLAGLGALSGARHGGANQLAFEMLSGLRSPDEARRWAREALAARHRFPGFGHRVYRCPDPRVAVLEPYARRMLESVGESARWEVYLALRSEVERVLGPRGIYANVDSITGLLYHPMGLPPAAFPIPFGLAIQTGWMAHCLEYLPEGAMISPGLVSVE